MPTTSNARQSLAPRVTRAAPLRSAGPRSARLVLVLALCCVAAAASGATTVYRSVDAEGRPVFSDTPPAPGERAEPIVIEAPTSYSAPPAAPDAGATWDWQLDGNAEDTATFAYGTVSVVAPAADEAVRDNAGNVVVSALLEPGLRPGHLLELSLDGAVVARSAGTDFQLEDVERGTHTIVVRVVDDAGTVLAESAPATFHMLRYAPLLAPNRPAAGSN